MINAVDDGQQNAEKTAPSGSEIVTLAEPVDEKNNVW